MPLALPGASIPLGGDGLVRHLRQALDGLTAGLI
jgi:hypothetical protein